MLHMYGAACVELHTKLICYSIHPPLWQCGNQLFSYGFYWDLIWFYESVLYTSLNNVTLDSDCNPQSCLDAIYSNHKHICYIYISYMLHIYVESYCIIDIVLTMVYSCINIELKDLRGTFVYWSHSLIFQVLM